MRNLANTIRIIIFGLLIAGALYCTVFCITKPPKPTYYDCGWVVSKSSEEVTIKHGVNTDLYLNVKFEKTGFKSVKVYPTTYFKYNRGDFVCFNLDKKVSPAYEIIWCIGGFIILMLLVLAGGWILEFLFK